MGIELKGFAEVQNDLKTMADNVDGKASDRALLAGAEVLYAKIVSNAQTAFKDSPHAERDGRPHLRETLKIGPIRRSVRKGKRITTGSYRVFHNHLVEQGHAGPHPAPGHPYVRPAFDTDHDKAFSAMRAVLKSELTNRT